MIVLISLVGLIVLRHGAVRGRANKQSHCDCDDSPHINPLSFDPHILYHHRRVRSSSGSARLSWWPLSFLTEQAALAILYRTSIHRVELGEVRRCGATAEKFRVSTSLFQGSDRMHIGILVELGPATIKIEGCWLMIWGGEELVRVK